MRLQICLERSIVLWAALGATDAVELDLEILQAYLFKNLHGHAYALRVYARLGRTENLYAELMMLPQAPRLRPLITEYRIIEIIHLNGLCFVKKLVFNIHAHYAGRSLGFKRY